MAKKEKDKFKGFSDANRVFDALKKEKRAEDFQEFLKNRKSKKMGGDAVQETQETQKTEEPQKGDSIFNIKEKEKK